MATTGLEGQAEILCNLFAAIGITEDVWFTWTAPTTAVYAISMCGQATIDSKLAVYPGAGCPALGSALACDDDFCAPGGPSRVTFNATAGSMYTIQLGDWPTATPGTGTFTIAPPPPPPANDDCTTPFAISGPGTYNFDNTLATTGTQYAATCGAIYKDAWWTYTATATGTATLTTCGFMLNPPGNTFDTKVAIYAGAGCPSLTSIACNDDSCAAQAFASTLTWPTVCGQVYTIRMGNFSSLATANTVGAFNIVETGLGCGTPTTVYCSGDGTATACPCGNSGAAGNGCANSLNPGGAHIAGSGVASVAADSFVLTGTGMPNASALYFQGTIQVAGGAGAVFGDGLRCAAGTVIRLATKLNSGGTSSYPSGTDTPIHTKGMIPITGGTRDYQVWYRNADPVFCPPATFNLSNGLQVTWLP
jgi:hypothetical protein